MNANDALAELRSALLGWNVLREEDGWFSVARLKSLLGVDRSTVRKQMEQLVGEGRAARSEGHAPGCGGKGFFYRILDAVLQKKFTALLTFSSDSGIHNAHGTESKRNRPRSRFRTTSGRRHSNGGF